jgi:hydrogenase/urease accessory protein HupE
MKSLKTTLLAVAVAGLAGPAIGHETGMPHAGGALHPILGLDHMLIVVAIAAAVGALAFWRR